MTSSPPLVEPLAARDGCDCPYWVIRCAHYDSKFVRIGKRDLIPDIRIRKTWRGRFAIEVPPESDDGIAIASVQLCSDDYDEALAAFYAAEEALLRGDA